MSQFVYLVFWNTALAGLLGVIVFLVQRHNCLKSRPGLAHFLWFLVLLKLVVPPVFSIPIPSAVSSPLSPLTSDGNGILFPTLDVPRSAPTDSVARQASWSLLDVLLVFAITGTVVFLLGCLVRTRRVARLVRLAIPGPDWLQEIVDALAREAGVQQRVSVQTINGCVSPFLWVTRSGPSIVMPSVLTDRLDRNNLRLIVRHEIQHYARGDHWTNLFSMIVGALLWWNPVAWWARRELRFAQELCCDASVLATNHGQRRRYAETLLQTIDFIASDGAVVPVPTTAFGSCSTFRRRIEMIGEKNLTSGVPYTARLLLLPLGAMLIAASPALGHDEEHAESLADMRGQIRELRDAVNDLQSNLMQLARQDRRSERDHDDDDRRGSWLTRGRMLQMAENARLNDEELVTLLQLGNSVDGNPQQFEKLAVSDDLNDKQRSVLRKLTRDRHRRDEEAEARDLKIDRLNREILGGMAERARLNERERDVLFSTCRER